jgi:predicted nucleotidyltransferase component of viral defense system
MTDEPADDRDTRRGDRGAAASIERFLYRLSTSPHRERFVLKGPTMFALWGTVYRPTRDLDFTGSGSSDHDEVLRVLREICVQPDAVEALTFNAETLRLEDIRDDEEYGGVRVVVDAVLGGARIPVKIDIGFGNDIVPAAEEAEYRTRLGDPAPRIRVYPPEAVVAEKLNAMVKRAVRDSRYKDLYDLYVMAGEFSFDGGTLVRSARATFTRRRTPLSPDVPPALGAAFLADDARQAQWRAYVNRAALPSAPAGFPVVGEQRQRFLRPLWDGAVADTMTTRWTTAEGWR